MDFDVEIDVPGTFQRVQFADWRSRSARHFGVSGRGDMKAALKVAKVQRADRDGQSIG